MHETATEETVREALRSRVLSQTGAQETVAEFWVPLSNERADLVAVGSSLHGFEIKTARDTLRRLPRQASAYGRVFDHCTAVVAEKHGEDAVAILPDWWGITFIADDRSANVVHFVAARAPRPNPATDCRTLVRLLWRDEAMSALLQLGGQPDKRSARGELWEALLDVASPLELQEIVCRAILARDPARARIQTRRFMKGPAFATDS